MIEWISLSTWRSMSMLSFLVFLLFSLFVISWSRTMLVLLSVPFFATLLMIPFPLVVLFFFVLFLSSLTSRSWSWSWLLFFFGLWSIFLFVLFDVPFNSVRIFSFSCRSSPDLNFHFIKTQTSSSCLNFAFIFFFVTPHLLQKHLHLSRS